MTFKRKNNELSNNKEEESSETESVSSDEEEDNQSSENDLQSGSEQFEESDTDDDDSDDESDNTEDNEENVQDENVSEEEDSDNEPVERDATEKKQQFEQKMSLIKNFIAQKKEAEVARKRMHETRLLEQQNSKKSRKSEKSAPLSLQVCQSSNGKDESIASDAISAESAQNDDGYYGSDVTDTAKQNIQGKPQNIHLPNVAFVPRKNDTISSQELLRSQYTQFIRTKLWDSKRVPRENVASQIRQREALRRRLH